MYIYPDNLKSKAVLWLWELRDIAIIGVGALISVFAMAQLGFLPPVVITAAYAFLSIRLEDNPTHQPIYCRFTSKKIINSPGYSGRSVR